jgi:hypothetical protein
MVVGPPEFILPTPLPELFALWAALRLIRLTLEEWVRLHVLIRWHFLNRRRVLDRRVMERTFEGPERRTGLDRRSLVPAGI